jgi:phosphoserine phosphatase
MPLRRADGDSVRAWLKKQYHGCALHGPPHVYKADWATLPVADRRRRMAVLAQPETFCIRSFEADPKLLPGLKALKAELRSAGHDVQVIGGALTNATSPSVSRTITTFASNPWSSTATTLD